MTNATNNTLTYTILNNAILCLGTELLIYIDENTVNSVKFIGELNNNRYYKAIRADSKEEIVFEVPQP